MSTYFISDLHLDPARAETYDKFARYLRSIKSDAQQLYILGDLFDYWIGDDGLDLIGHHQAVELLEELTESGTHISLMHGNRDFLIGEDFLSRFSGTLIPDPQLIVIGGKVVLLMHGDSLCTDDVEHQRYREIVLSPEWQSAVLELPITERLQRALDMRMQSETGKAKKNLQLMDVNQQTVVDVMLKHEADILIHGHVHRPGIHQVQANGQNLRRYVLGDWDSGNDGVIRVSSSGEFNLYLPSGE